MKTKIKWSPYRDIQGMSNMCGIFQGKFIDIVNHGNLWYIIFDGNKQLNRPFKVRIDAQEWAEEAFENNYTLSFKNIK
jgi:hypothetical protein